MTIGEKIKNARKNAGLSQTQLAQKLCVSRAAIAKWETDAGLPDVMNLKALADLLNVSVDQLLDDSVDSDYLVTKEPLDPIPAEDGRKAYHALVLARFPDADYIYPLTCVHNLNRVERVINILMFGLLTFIWQLSHWKEYTGHYYWVDTAERQVFVRFEDGFMICENQSRRLLRSERGGCTYIRQRKFMVGYDLIK